MSEIDKTEIIKSIKGDDYKTLIMLAIILIAEFFALMTKDPIVIGPATFVIFLILVVFVITRTFNYFESQNNVRVIYGDNPKKIVQAYTVKSTDKLRQDKFEELNKNISHNLSVYGIGITSLVSKRKEFLLELLRKNINVNLCMIDPNILNSEICFKENCVIKDKPNVLFKEICNNVELEDLLRKMNFQIFENHIDLYYKRNLYYDDIRKSYNRLQMLLKEVNNDETITGKLEVHLIKSFIPISINIKDKEKNDSEMIVEFNMPFTSYKTLLVIKKMGNEEFFSRFLELYNNIWNNSETLVEGGNENGEIPRSGTEIPATQQ